MVDAGLDPSSPPCIPYLIQKPVQDSVPLSDVGVSIYHPDREPRCPVAVEILP
jgi:hypothetical protein